MKRALRRKSVYEIVVPSECPNCKRSLEGDVIPDKYRDHYGGATHYTKVLAHQFTDFDKVAGWRCPFCSHIWQAQRFKSGQVEGDQ
jgi:hypothetical protein